MLTNGTIIIKTLSRLILLYFLRFYNIAVHFVCILISLQAYKMISSLILQYACMVCFFYKISAADEALTHETSQGREMMNLSRGNFLEY